MPKNVTGEYWCVQQIRTRDWIGGTPVRSSPGSSEIQGNFSLKKNDCRVRPKVHKNIRQSWEEPVQEREEESQEWSGRIFLGFLKSRNSLQTVVSEENRCHSIRENMQGDTLTEPKLKIKCRQANCQLQEHKGSSLDCNYPKKIIVGIFSPHLFLQFKPICRLLVYRLADHRVWR